MCWCSLDRSPTWSAPASLRMVSIWLLALSMASSRCGILQRARSERCTRLSHATVPHTDISSSCSYNRDIYIYINDWHWICSLNACIDVLVLLKVTYCPCCTGSEVPGTGQLHDDGRRGAVHVFQQRHWDVGYRSTGWQNEGLANVTVKLSGETQYVLWYLACEVVDI